MLKRSQKNKKSNNTMPTGSKKNRSRGSSNGNGNKNKSSGGPTNGVSSSNNGKSGVVPKNYADRPYFESTFPKPSGRGGSSGGGAKLGGMPMLNNDISFSRAGVGVVYRDADSSQRALLELQRKRQQRLERKRAAGLLLFLGMFAFCVHVITHGDAYFASEEGSSSLSFGGGGSSSSFASFVGRGRGVNLIEGNTFQTARDKHYNVDGSKILYGGETISTITSGLSSQDGNSTSKNSNSTSIKKKKTAEKKIDFKFYDSYVKSINPPTDNDVPFFFHVPRSGGQTFKEIVGTCLGIVQAAEVGVREGHGQDTELQVVEINDGKYINVDTTSIEGIKRAADLGLASSKAVGMITSSYFAEVSELIFSKEHPARAFIILRNPMERAVSMYHFKQQNGELDADVTLEDYGQGNGIENNWITRYLTDAMEGELKRSHLEAAKQILQNNFLIGFLDDSEESMIRIMKYMGWDFASSNAEDEDMNNDKAIEQQECMKDKLNNGVNKNPVGEYELPKKGSRAHALIAWQTQYDMKLYDFAKLLFEKQTKIYGSKQRKKELKKKNKEAKAKEAEASR